MFTTESKQPGVLVGPIPAGMPVELLANLQLAVDTGGTLDQLKLSAELMPIMMDGLLTPQQPGTLAMDLGRREQDGHWAMVLW